MEERQGGRGFVVFFMGCSFSLFFSWMLASVVGETYGLDRSQTFIVLSMRSLQAVGFIVFSHLGLMKHFGVGLLGPCQDHKAKNWLLYPPSVFSPQHSLTREPIVWERTLLLTPSEDKGGLFAAVPLFYLLCSAHNCGSWFCVVWFFLFVFFVIILSLEQWRWNSSQSSGLPSCCRNAVLLKLCV